VGGAMAFLSRFFPSRTNNISEVLRDLPDSDEVPGAEGWQAVFTPGHAPGHVSFWRAVDRALVAGDAMATADLDSWYGLIGQKQKISRPASPFTFDWGKARHSVRLLADLKPTVLACGHGEPMVGEHVASELEAFANTFTPPEHGRYVETPAKTNDTGVVFEPPAPPDHLPKIAAGLVAGAFLIAGLFFSKRGKRSVPSSGTSPAPVTFSGKLSKLVHGELSPLAGFSARRRRLGWRQLLKNRITSTAAILRSRSESELVHRPSDSSMRCSFVRFP